MLHSNSGELHQLFSTFNRVWGAGGDASLSLKTVDGKVSAVLEIQLGPPSAPRPGAPEAQQQAAGNWNQQPGQHRSQRRRGTRHEMLHDMKLGENDGRTASRPIHFFNPHHHRLHPLLILLDDW